MRGCRMRINTGLIELLTSLRVRTKQPRLCTAHIGEGPIIGHRKRALQILRRATRSCRLREEKWDIGSATFGTQSGADAAAPGAGGPGRARGGGARAEGGGGGAG